MGKKIPMWAVLLTLAFSVVMFMYSQNVFGKLLGDAFACDYGDMHIPLLISAVFAALIALCFGWKWSVMEKGILASIDRAMVALLTLLAVGLMISSWIASGVVPAMIYYGLKIITPSAFLVTACILSLIVALATGSSWTTLGTIGVALIGIGGAMGFSPGATAGAAIVGAYAGDKMSPLSDTTLMAPAVSGTDVFTHIRHMMYTVTPSFVISLVVFFILGLRTSGVSETSQIIEMQEALAANFNINPWLLLPPLVVVAIVVFKIPALPGLAAGVAMGCVMGCIFQDMGFGEWFSILHYGFRFADTTGIPATVVDLLTRGGMSSMLWTLNMTLCVMCFAGIMDATGMMKTITDWLLSRAKGRGSLVLVTVLTCICINVIACSQYLSILLTGRMYKRAYEDARLKPENLSRVLEDAGTVTSPLVPWNSCGVTLLALMGVPTMVYFPYAVLCYINPIISVIYGYTGFSMTKMTDAEYEKVMALRAEEDAKEAAAAAGA